MATRKEIADHLDMSTKTLARLIAEGIIDARQKGGIDMDQARVAYIRRLRRDATGRPIAGDYSEERTRLTKAQADKAEAEVESIRGVTVEARTIVHYWGELIANARARLLALPSAITPRLQAAEDEHAMVELLTEEVEHALDELAATGLPPDGVGLEPSEQTMESTTTTQAVRVGG